ncbi:MAG: hypothetical protein MJY82_05375 [Fibrobacter sp.]|nr:hypothetical protein [Fibrobacter sp.]
MRTFSKVSLNFLAAACLALSLVACGGDDSSSFVEPEKESSSSEILSSGDGTSDGNGDKSSSSVSSLSTNSSSSAKSSSSTGDKNSGGESSPASSSVKSSSSGTSAGSSAGNSSSSKAEDLSCTPEEEGQTFEFTLTGKKYICKNGSLIEIASSSSAVPTSSYFDMSKQFNEKVSYGEFTDPRDGQKYRTVTIDYKYHMRGVDSVTIFAENLNFGKMIAGGTVQGDSTKYCYDDDPWYCENGWGGLYTWSNAMGFPAVCDSVSIASEKCPNKFDYSNKNEKFDGYINFLQHQGICPEGWHVMNEDIWALLSEMSHGDVGYYMGSKVAGFGNENLYGMSLLPTGYWERYPNGTTVFQNIKEQTLFWLPEQNSDYPDEAKLTNVMDNQTSRGGARKKNDYAHSVRCVKNY